jgi:calcium channel MID1
MRRLKPVFISLSLACWLACQRSLVHAQITLPFLTNGTILSSASPTSFKLPAALILNISVSICTTTAPFPRFFISNDSHVGLPGPGSSSDVTELEFDEGLANWSGPVIGGGTLVGWGVNGPPGVDTTRRFQFGAVNGGRDVTGSPQVPLALPKPSLGDTTASQAIIHSRPFLSQPLERPSFPNYTLPSANFSSPSAPSTMPNFTPILLPTTSTQSLQLVRSACAVLEQLSGKNLTTGRISSQTPVLRSENWKMQWLVEGLAPSTNYTVFMIEDGLKMSGPLRFTTKSSSFSCPLLHSVSFCPSVSYAVPLPPPPAPLTTYTGASLPDSIATPLLSSLSNFTTSLLTFACGRDVYSPLQTCLSCQVAYRDWLCLAAFPRCGEASPASLVPAPRLTKREANAAPRSPFIAALPKAYDEVLPCIETCHTVARACPAFLQWNCPVVGVNAEQSYGVGVIDSTEREERGGFIGAPQDFFGNVWCNA